MKTDAAMDKLVESVANAAVEAFLLDLASSVYKEGSGSVKTKVGTLKAALGTAKGKAEPPVAISLSVTKSVREKL